MLVSVRLAEPFWRPVGKRDIELNLADGARVADLIARLREDYPALDLELDQSPPHIFIDDVEVTPASFLTESGRVHLVWPLAGG